tara:strand:- start:21 stop:230 length:210 start_codon:yes stop_codon:yes gene_type:complete
MEVSAKAASEGGSSQLQTVFLEAVRTVMASELESDDEEDEPAASGGSSGSSSKPAPAKKQPAKRGCVLL